MMNIRDRVGSIDGARLAACMAIALLAGCETIPEEDRYVLYRENIPRSILVLPPVNESLDANASYSYVTTVSEPIGEQGYYVFPVAVVAEFMKDNGLPTPEDMHGVSLAKIDEIIGADAVLYIALEEFGQKFELLSSTTRVYARAQLVDVKTGQVLWTNSVKHAVSNNGSNQGGLLGNLVSAAITQIGHTINDRTHDAAVVANNQWLQNSDRGLLVGPLHPKFGIDAEGNPISPEPEPDPGPDS